MFKTGVMMHEQLEGLRSLGVAPFAGHNWVGEIVGVDESGRCWVRPQGGLGDPVEACLTATAARRQPQLQAGDRVLILTGESEDDPPVIVDLIATPVPSIADAQDGGASAEHHVRVDGREVVIEADQELVLRCGRASITLKRNGKIVLKGDHLLSYSRGTNRIKGGSVHIN